MKTNPLADLLKCLADCVIRVEANTESGEVKLYESQSQRGKPNETVGDIVGRPGCYKFLVNAKYKYLKGLEAKSKPLLLHKVRREIFLHKSRKLLVEFLTER